MERIVLDSVACGDNSIDEISKSTDLHKSLVCDVLYILAKRKAIFLKRGSGLVSSTYTGVAVDEKLRCDFIKEVNKVYKQ